MASTITPSELMASKLTGHSSVSSGSLVFKARLYGLDYLAIGPFHRIAHEYGIAVVLVHHTRKMDADNAFDTVSGSHGLTGAADTVLVIKQHPGGVTLHAAG